MINFRRVRQEFSPEILKKGKQVFDAGSIESAKIISLKATSVRVSCVVLGNFENHYTCELEFDRKESEIIDSDCDCPYNYDCQHIAAVLFYLEEHLDSLIVSFSKESNPKESVSIDDHEKTQIQKTIREAETKEIVRKGKKHEKELLEEYYTAAAILAKSPLFMVDEVVKEEKGELLVIIVPPENYPQEKSYVELRLALRLPSRSKALHIHNVKEFFEAVRYHEPIYLGNKLHYFGLRSFDAESGQILKMLMDFSQFPELKKGAPADSKDKIEATLILTREAMGALLAHAYSMAQGPRPMLRSDQEEELPNLPCFYWGGLEEPLRCSTNEARLRFEIQYLEMPTPKIFLNPAILTGKDNVIDLDQALLFESSFPGVIHELIYYRFHRTIRRKHLRHLGFILDTTIPEPLFGTFIENSLPELMRYGQVTNRQAIEKIVTLPYTDKIGVICDLHYLNNELEATLTFIYGKIKVPAIARKLTMEEVSLFMTPEGIMARNLSEEQKIIDNLFQDFQYDEREGVFVAKTEKKIVEFMTDVIPRHQDKIKFNCPESLLEKFIYDDTHFTLKLGESGKIDAYRVDLLVEGDLNGIKLDLLWDCLASKRNYIELGKKEGKQVKRGSKKRDGQILVLDLQRLAPVIQIFDEIGLRSLEDHTEERPLWSLASLDQNAFEGLPIKFSITPGLYKIQRQMLGLEPLKAALVPTVIKGTLRSYQEEGVFWLDRLRQMRLNGILADDMGLGKTLQAIIAITQYHQENAKDISLVVCPTSLIYNWAEEFNRFNPKLKILPIDGTPTQRKKLIEKVKDYDVVITSYSLIQKDIDKYKQIEFGYVILDEAQHIKNRSTLNAKSVKILRAAHKLILTGTPIENSLDELWSLFDFLMPGLLSTYDRFVEKFVRAPIRGESTMDQLKRKVAPFILRRMKEDVLKDLPPLSKIIYHTHLSPLQRELYHAYANSAREELSRLVAKEGFDKVQIQVLATLTRLKQICCHPAIFAKEKAEPGDSAKYEMLMELIGSLMDAGRKTVIFSQYTNMLKIMKNDFEQKGIRFCYLDGSTKDRMSIVKEFNESPDIPIFLVSLKAGGTGLNIVGADNVILYDSWWNPAVEDQADGRVHRIGQKASSVCSYKLVILGTIEEKIIEMQERKKGLVKKVIADDDEALSKLTWEEVLELLKC